VASDSESLLGDNATCPLSFDPATPVLMADGSTRAIADIRPGDQVASTAIPLAPAGKASSSTGNGTAQPVTAWHDNADTDMADVTVATGDGRTAVIHTTQFLLY